MRENSRIDTLLRFAQLGLLSLVAGGYILLGGSCIPQERDDDAELRGVVAEYIATTKKWPKDDYSIERYRTEGSLVVFIVVHKDDKVDPRPGGGKSVVVYVDPETMNVTRELFFQ
jgi:hypothetical protein